MVLAFVSTVLCACFPQTIAKPNDQKVLDEQYYALWQDAVAHQNDPLAVKTGKALAAFMEETSDALTDKMVKNWVCKPWNLQAKEIKLTTGSAPPALNASISTACVVASSISLCRRTP